MDHTARLLTAAACAASLVAFADYPANDIISLNISNDSAYKMEGSGETETLAGTLPDNAWQNTSNADRTGVVHSGDARNGYRNGVTAWDGTAQAVTNLDGVVFTWAVEGSGTANYGNLETRTPVFRRVWLARASGAGEFTSVVVQNIPYEKYDVIVYVSGNASATDVRAVLINGVPYKGDTGGYENNTRVAASNTSTWGNVGSDTLALGGNALRVNGLASPDLQVSMKNATTWGICAIQIVRDMSAGVGNAQRATGKVISVNLQSAKNTTGYTTGDIGIVRVPAEAWTADGLALANNEANYDSDVDVAIKEWDGATGTTSELTGTTLHEKVKNAYYYGASSYVPQPQVLSSYADDYNGSSWRGTITVTGVPYKKYDVIVYCATDTENKYFGPVSVNGTPYHWSESNKTTREASSADSSDSTHWGFSQSRVMAYGGNALRIVGQTSSTLVIKGANNASSCRGGIAGFQIVNTYDPSAVETRTIEDGGTLVLGVHLTEALRVVCEGSFTITGTGGHVVDNDDLAQLDLDSVTGTVTLGADTLYMLGSSRQLPSLFAFGAGSKVQVEETVGEYYSDSFAITGLGGASYLVLARYDGTYVTLDVTDGGATRGDGSGATVTGAAAYYEFAFDNTLSTTEGSRHSAEMEFDNDPQYYTLDDGGTGVGAEACPYVSVASGLPNWGEFSIVVIGTMPSDSKRVFVSFGSTYGGRKSLFLATGSEENKVIVGYGNQSSVEVLATLTVPHAAVSRHFYAFTVSENKTKMTIYLDGMKWKTVTSASGFQIGTSDHSGVQGGSGYGGLPAGGYERASDGIFDSLLVYDYPITERQIELLGEIYPYSPAGGSYSREVSSATTLETATATWTKAGEIAPGYTLPANGAAVAIVAAEDAEVTVNATLSADSLNLSGDGALSLKKGGGRLTSDGLTTIATEVTIESDAADISGAPTILADGGSLHFDYSGYVLDGFTVDGALIPLTGAIDEQPVGAVTCDVPSGRAARLNKAAFVYTNDSYQLVFSLDHAPTNVWLDAGAQVLDDDTVGTRYEGEEPVRSYVAAGDTVCFSAADAISESRAYPVAGFDFGEFAGSVTIDVADGKSVVNSQKFSSPTGTVVKTGAGELKLTADNSASLDIREGVVKLGRAANYSFWNAEEGLPTVSVADSAVFDINGAAGYKASISLASGATWTNTGADRDESKAQAYALSLSGDATVDAESQFGVLANGWGATTMDLGANTLTKIGASKFMLCNCTVSGSGTIAVEEGELYLYNGVTAPDATFSVAENCTLKVRRKEGGTPNLRCAALAGEGTVDLGLARPAWGLNFAAGSDLALEITLASYTESSVRIPYTGEPKSVTVYEPDSTTVCSAATVTREGGFINISVEVVNATYQNPAKYNDQATFTYAFRGAISGEWADTGNWKRIVNSRWSEYANTLAPALHGSSYDPVLFDGALMTTKRSVTVDTLEGWTLRVGLFNGADVTIDKVTKLQGGCWFLVDETSKLTLGRDTRDGSNGNNVDFYVAASEGLVFTGNFDFKDCETIGYSLSGAGSVVFQNGVTNGTQKLLRVIRVPIGAEGRGVHRGVVTKKLIALNPAVYNQSFDISQTDVSSDGGISMTKVSKTLTGAMTDELGEYSLTQEADGVYLRYIGYSAEAKFPHFSIILR